MGEAGLMNTVFQSPPSVRKATVPYFALRKNLAFQSPPSVRKATTYDPETHVFSLFQSPPSVRKATVHRDILDGRHTISIPAFREEGDRRI